jgi:hypothetical protein
MNKDWTGNKKSTFTMLGASNHSEGERETNDFYSTDPHTLEIFLEALKRDGIELHTNIWEPACGMGHLSEVLKSKGYDVYSSDLIDRGYGVSNINFLECTDSLTYDILTNPPYKYAQEFVEHALEISYSGAYVVMLLKIQFLEGNARRKLFDKYPPKYVYVNSERQTCYINGDMSKKMSSASCYCWFVWEKGFTGDPVIKWI